MLVVVDAVTSLFLRPSPRETAQGRG
eukprot:COSAG06_NODE_57196_length_281_cov_0.851648_1_plen_25_part_01